MNSHMYVSRCHLRGPWVMLPILPGVRTIAIEQRILHGLSFHDGPNFQVYLYILYLEDKRKAQKYLNKNR